MKRCIILAFLLIVVAGVMAQQPLSLDVQKRLAERQLHYGQSSARRPMVYISPSVDTSKVDLYKQLLEAQRLQKGGLITATYSHTIDKGKVYQLTPDNMPCLVPDMKTVAPMPNPGGFLPDDRMNALPRQRIIPREGDKKYKK